MGLREELSVLVQRRADALQKRADLEEVIADANKQLAELVVFVDGTRDMIPGVKPARKKRSDAGVPRKPQPEGGGTP